MIPLIYNVRSLKRRRTMTLVTALGIALVVFVLAASLMLVEGIDDTFFKHGSRRHGHRRQERKRRRAGKRN